MVVDVSEVIAISAQIFEVSFTSVMCHLDGSAIIMVHVVVNHVKSLILHDVNASKH